MTEMPRGSLAAVEGALQQWRAAHPAATLAEIETELDHRLAAARAALLQDLVAEGTAALPITCPQCGHRLVQRGQYRREVATTGGELVELRRHYATCPACGAGLFPPR